MKLSHSIFKGELPRVTPRLLPDGYAVSNTNGRIISGDLTAWKEPTSISTLSPATLQALYKMQTLNAGNDVFLRSANDVNWARGIISGDVNETILFTGFPDNPTSGGTLSAGTARPKITNFGMATGGTIHTGQTAGNYPNNWLLLGVPAPTVAPSATSVPIATGSPTNIGDGEGATPAADGWTVDAGTITSGTDTTIGTGHDYKFTDPARMHRDASVGTSTGDGISFQVQITGNSKFFDFRFASDPGTGEGPVIRLTTSSTTAQTDNQSNANGMYQIGRATSFSAAPSFTTSGPIVAPQTGLRIRNADGEDFEIPLYTSVFQGGTTYTANLTVSVSGSTYTARFQISTLDVTFNFTPTSTTSTYVAFKTGGSTLYIDTVSTNSNLSTTDAESTSYVFTWVNFLGQEGAPSPASPVVQFSTGLTTTITGISDPSSGDVTDYGLSGPASPTTGLTSLGYKKLYRAATNSDGETEFLFVDTIAYGTTTYTDGKSDSGLGEALTSTNWFLPPVDGFNIISLPNGLTMMASKNNIYVSEQNHPHTYPLDYVLTTDFPVVGLSHIDNTVIVMTQAWTYVISGSSPTTLSMVKLEIPYGCVSKRSIANLKGFGTLYATPNGLVAINPAGPPEIITEDYFTREQWQALTPANIYSWVHDDRYFFISGTTMYLFDPKESGIGLSKIDISVATNDTYVNNITAAYADPVTDKLYFVHSGNKLALWNSHSNKLVYDYTTRLMLSPYPSNFFYAQLRGPGISSTVFYLIADGSTIYTVTRTAQGEFVVPEPTQPCREWQFRLTGSDTVEVAEVAETVEELE